VPPAAGHDLSKFAVDGDALGRSGRRGELAKVFAPGFEAVHRVCFRLSSVDRGECAVLAGVDLRGGRSQGVKYLLHLGRLRRWPVGEWLLLADQAVDLFELDEVGPVGA
jgi:hypothetical protein